VYSRTLASVHEIRSKDSMSAVNVFIKGI